MRRCTARKIEDRRLGAGARGVVPSSLVRPEQITEYHTVSRPSLHPDGHRVAFEVARADAGTDRYERRIWLWDGQARQFTAGPDDTQPRWSPDGTRLAFLRKDGDDPAQLAVMPADGGEARVITGFALGVRAFEWSPSGDMIAAVATEWTSEWADLDEAERRRRPRRIERARYRADNRGWTHDRRQYVWLVEPDAARGPERLTGHRWDELSPVWSPDGTRIALLTTLDDDRGLAPGTDVVEVDLATRRATLRDPQGGWFSLAYDPEGALYAIGDADPLAWPELTSLWELRPEGPRDRTGHLDRSIWSFLLPEDMARPVWLPAEGTAAPEYLVGLEDSGRLGVVRVTADGEARHLLDGDRYITGFSTTPDAGRVVFTASSPTSPGELYELTAGGEQPLTDFNAAFTGGAGLTGPDHFRVKSDGVEIDTWVFLPPGDGPVPVLLNIHGGPAAQYGFAFFDEFQVYAGAGFGVVACNPRGSSGRGREFVRAVVGEGWGTVDVADVTAALEGALERHPRLDAGRVGVMGGSYGGFLTAWLLSHSDRFASAVVERALLNWESFSGTSDIAPHFSTMYLGAVPPSGREALAAASPTTYADRIATPTLILHSENDYRCPIEQAEQLFMTLLRNGIEVAFVRFPDESHELSRSGKPRHRIERFEAVLEWHRRHLTTCGDG